MKKLFLAILTALVFTANALTVRGGPSVELLSSGPSDTLEKLFTTI